MKRRSNTEPMLCGCGCGEPTKKARNGTYNRFCHGHNTKSQSPDNAGSNGRNSQGQWSAGVSGNPLGSKTGSRHKIPRIVANVLDESATAISEKAVEMALNGDRAMIKMIVERILPVKKSVPVSLPDMPTINDVKELPLLTAFVLQAVSKGQLSATDAATLSNVVRNHKEALIVGQLTTRLEQLEQQLTAGQ